MHERFLPSVLPIRPGGVAALPPAAAHEARVRLLRCGWLHTCTRVLRQAARARAEVAAGLVEAAGQLLRARGSQLQPHVVQELHSLSHLWEDRLSWESTTQCLLQVVSPVWLLLSPPEPGAHSLTGGLPSPAGAAATPVGASMAGGEPSATGTAAPAAAPLLSVSPSACGAVCELLVSASKAVQGAAVAVRQLREADLFRQQQQHQQQQQQHPSQEQQRHQPQAQQQPCRSDPAGGAAHVPQQDKELGAYGVHTSAGSRTQQQEPGTHGRTGCSSTGTATTIDTDNPTASSHSVAPPGDPRWAWLARHGQDLEAEQRRWVDCLKDVLRDLLPLVLTGRQSWLVTVPELCAPELRALDPASRRASGASPGVSAGSHGPVVACGQDQAAALRGAAAYVMCVVGRTALEELRGVEGSFDPLLEWGWEQQGGRGAEAMRPEHVRVVGGVTTQEHATAEGCTAGQGQGQEDNGRAGDAMQRRPPPPPLQQPHQEQWALLRNITSRQYYRVSVLLSYLVCPLCDWLPGGRGHVAWLLPPPRSLQRLLVGSCHVLLRTTHAAASLPPSPEHTADVKRTSHWCVTYLLGAVLRLSCHVVLGPHVRLWLGRRLSELAGEAAVGAAAGGAGGSSLQTATAGGCDAAATASAQLHEALGPELLTLAEALAELAVNEGNGSGGDMSGLVEGLARAAAREQRVAKDEGGGVGMGPLGGNTGVGDGGGVSGGSRVGDEAFRRAARALAAEWTRLKIGAGALPPSLRAQRGKGQLGGRQLEQEDASGGAGGGVGGRREVGGREGVLEVEVEAPRVCGNPECVNFEGDAEGALKFRRCGGCGAVRYCGADCQRAHWRAGHREECKR